jgi:arylsulfatase
MRFQSRILAAAVCFLPASASGLTAERPNVIVVITDDQGYGDFSCHGNPVLKTPNLDRLAAESVRLTDFHVAPMCTPTRGQLLSGRDCLRNGAMNVSSGRTSLRRDSPTMAELFAAAGYQCGQFGKWHVGDNYPYRPHDRGFHEAIYYPSSHISSAPDFWNNDYFDDTYWHNNRRERFEGYTTDVFFREATRWMKSQADAGRPFLCYLATAAAHGPLFVPQKYRELYSDQKRGVASFFGMIANIDENVGRLEDFLRNEGLRDNTLLIFLTDNGGTAGVPVYNAGMRGRKIDLYDGGHRAPCFVRWPQGGFGPSRDVGELTQVQDLLPTILELCDVPSPADVKFDGVSLAPLLRGEQVRLDDRMLVIQFSRMNAPRPQKGDACVLWRKWRLVGDKELYDLAGDPAQKEDVAGRFPEIVAKLRAHYERWWGEVKPRLDEFSRVVIGSDAETRTLLSPCEWADVFLDQSAQVRRGESKNGVWHLEIEREGEYEFVLRRWPEEANTAITAATPPYQGADGVFPAGVALPIAKARIKVQGHDETSPVAPDDKAVAFTARLQSGPAELQTWFYDAEGKELCGAYYVVVKRNEIDRP